MRFVVMKNIRAVGVNAIEEAKGALVAIQYDPYNKGGQRDPIYTADADAAFHFHNHTSAEIAAVTVGGYVTTMEQARKELKGE